MDAISATMKRSLTVSIYVCAAEGNELKLEVCREGSLECRLYLDKTDQVRLRDAINAHLERSNSNEATESRCQRALESLAAITHVSDDPVVLDCVTHARHALTGG